MISTLGKLEKFGFEKTSAGSSEGEISINPQKPFSDFLFMYKPQKEQLELQEYLKNGGMSNREILQIYQQSATQRIKEQGFSL